MRGVCRGLVVAALSVGLVGGADAGTMRRPRTTLVKNKVPQRVAPSSRPGSVGEHALQSALSNRLQSGASTNQVRSSTQAPKAAIKARVSRSTWARRKGVRGFRENFEGERKQRLADQAADAHIAEVMRHSEASGDYFIVSDLHWGVGKLRNDGPWDSREDFRRGDVFARFLGRIATRPNHTTMVIAGDWLELMEHVDANASKAEVDKAVTRIVEGHAHEVKAMAAAVTQKGLRIIYNAGNHDVQLVDGQLRAHLIREMIRVGGLSGPAAQQFRERIAFTGHAAVLGRHGEGLVVHGHAQDAANNWRAIVNPYNASRSLQQNAGWDIVSLLFRKMESSDPELDNNGKSATRSVALRVLTSPKYILTAGRALWRVLGQQPWVGKSGQLSERLDDRLTMREWVARTGFAARMATPIPGANSRQLSGSQWAREFEQMYQRMPSPIHERMKTPLRTLNLLASLVSLPFLKSKLDAAEPTLLGDMTGQLPNVRYVVWGHSHQEGAVVGNSAKGELAHYNSGSWTKTDGQWRLNVVHGSTDAAGRLTMNGVFRTDLGTGDPSVTHEASAKNLSIPGWK